MTDVQLAEFSTLPQSIVREAREISTELTRQKEVDVKSQFVFQSPHFISIYQSFRKNETGGFSLAQSQIMRNLLVSYFNQPLQFTRLDIGPLHSQAVCLGF